MATTPRDVYVILNEYPWKMLVKYFIGTASSTTDLTIYDLSNYRNEDEGNVKLILAGATTDPTTPNVIFMPKNGTVPTPIAVAANDQLWAATDGVLGMAPHNEQKKVSFIIFNTTFPTGDPPANLGYCCRADMFVGIRDIEPEDAFV